MHWTWCIPNPFSVETNRTAQDAQNPMLNPFSALFGKWGTKRQSRDRAIQIRKDDQVVARQTVPNLKKNFKNSCAVKKQLVFPLYRLGLGTFVWALDAEVHSNSSKRSSWLLCLICLWIT